MIKKHMYDYSDYDLIDMEDFIEQFDLIRDFIFAIDYLGTSTANNHLDFVINKLQKLKDKKKKPQCLINTDALTEALIIEEKDAYDNFQDILNEYENGVTPSRSEMLDDYISEKTNELQKYN